MTRPTILSLLIALAVISSAAAQPAAPPILQDGTEVPIENATTIAVEPAGGGEARQYPLTDVSFSVSRSLDYSGEPRIDISISLSFSGALDPFLLEWARLDAGSDGARQATISVEVPEPDGSSRVMRYELEGARIVSFSATHSRTSSFAPVALQMSARRLSIDGVSMN